MIGEIEIKTIIDVDAIIDAVAKQMSRPPALPQKAQKAFQRICALLDRAVPDVEMQPKSDANDDDGDDGSESEEDAPKQKKDKKSKKRRDSSGGENSSKKKVKKNR